MDVTVATFNIHHGRGRDGVVDLRRTAEVIRATGAGVVALQELDRGQDRSGGDDQPARLAELVGMEVHFFPTIAAAAGEYGIGIAARAPLEPRYVSLPRLGSEEPRGAIAARTAGFSLVAMHLSRWDKARVAQLAAVVELAATLDPPVVVVGDFNARRRHLSPLVEAGFRPSPTWRPTVGIPFWPRQIDHILTGPGATLRRLWTLGGAASDHRAVARVVAPNLR